MKGIAICAMLLHHLYASPITESIESYGGFLRWIGIVGKVCVSIFLFCSGYGMSVQYRKVESWSDSTVFLRRRLIKLYTNFWVVYAIFVPITVFFFNRPLSAAYGYHTHLYKEVASVFLDLLCRQIRERQIRYARRRTPYQRILCLQERQNFYFLLLHLY